MTIDLTERLAAGIRRHRESAGWSQRELGEAIGLEGRTATQTIHAYETGTKSPRLGRVQELADIFEVDPSELFVVVEEETDGEE